jgi:phosphotransferase system enzyme I (PtsP)
MGAGPITLVPVVHAKGDAARLDALLDLMRLVARPGALTVGLDEIPRRLAALFPCDVCSIYLLEGEELVMRGNVGFPADALGEVRLAIGQGITGMAVEMMRPISLDVAARHTRNRTFPVLHEERFPIFMATPIAGPSGPLGALVLRRREPPAFDQAEVELATALTAPIAALVERARLSAALRTARDGGPREGRSAGVRRVTLPGRQLVAGRAVGRLRVFRRPSPRRRPNEPRRGPEELAAALRETMAAARRMLESLERRARGRGIEVGFLSGHRLFFEDARLPERVLEHAALGGGLAHALTVAGAEASRAALRRGDSFSLERARAIDDLCEALALLTGELPEVPRGAVMAGEEVTFYDLLVSERLQPAAVVLAAPGTPLASALLALLGVPAVGDVDGLFRWAADGDVVIVDGDHALVRVNPRRSELARLRDEQREPSLPER